MFGDGRQFAPDLKPLKPFDLCAMPRVARAFLERHSESLQRLVRPINVSIDAEAFPRPSALTQAFLAHNDGLKPSRTRSAPS
jgi:hypothetical protein